MGLFYRYMCKRCGQMYVELPLFCCKCNTRLSYLCPLDMCIPENTGYIQTNDCEEIKRFILRSRKNQRIRILESRVKELEKDLYMVDEIRSGLKMQNEILENDLLYERKKYLQLDQLARNLIPKDTMEADRCAMKKLHPDNGGNAEDFMKFKKAYDELTNK